MQKNLVPFDEIKSALVELCAEKQCGVLYISADTNEGAIIALDKGAITDAGFKSYRGIAALPFIRRIQKAKYIFKEGEDTFPGKREDRLMPPTADILQYLDIKPDKMESKVLVIDDSRVVRRVFLHTLKKSNYIVLEAENGEEGLEIIEQEHPDLILLDLVLPGIDGYEVLHRIRQSEASKQIPVIVLTSKESLIEEGKGKESQADEYLTKPFKPDELLEILSRYL